VNFVTVTDADDAIANITIAPTAALTSRGVTVTTGNYKDIAGTFTVRP